MSEVTLKLRKHNNSLILCGFFSVPSTRPLSSSRSLALSLALPPCPSLVRFLSLSLAPLEGDAYYLVLRPLLDFYFSLCGVCSMPLRWKNALLMMIILLLWFWHYG